MQGPHGTAGHGEARQAHPTRASEAVDLVVAGGRGCFALPLPHLSSCQPLPKISSKIFPPKFSVGLSAGAGECEVRVTGMPLTRPFITWSI